MRIRFLGTGGVLGVPVWNCSCGTCQSRDPKDKRLRSALLVEIDGKNIAIDFGPDFRTQLLREKVKRLDYAFITHGHGDHIYGYAELSRQDGLALEAPAEPLRELRRRMGSSAGWLERRNPTIRIREFAPKRIGGVRIDTVRMHHAKDGEKRPVISYGYVFRSKSFSFAYLTDYSKIIEEDKLQNLDLLISDGNGMEPRHGHVGVNGSLEVFERLRPKRMLLTHINHKTGHKELCAHVKKSGNVSVAYDGMTLTF